MVIEAGGKLYAWAIPLSLPLKGALAAKIAVGEEVALVNSSGEIVGTLAVSDVFEWDKQRYIEKVYGTSRTDHPGADMVLKNDADNSHLIGGTIRTLPQPKDPDFGDRVLSPREVRELLAAKGWERVVAFQTRNPLHRAHEYALVYGLEELIRAGANAGACLNPLVGETKGDDVNAKVRMRTYEALIEARAIGEGDSDPALWGSRDDEVADRVILLGLDIKMFYAGPREAVMHAIYRQNYGFSDIIIGRKHADAPFADGTAIWGDFDAQEIFENLGGELVIKPLKVGFAAYYESIGRVDLMENHSDEKPVFISGKQVRETLLAGEAVDPRIMRESTSKILVEAMAGN
jgi:sulfate adenylyltransferase